MNARLALKVRVDQETRAHTRVSVFVGTDLGSLGLAGTLTFRTEEWAMVRSRLARMTDPNMVVLFEAVSQLAQVPDVVEDELSQHARRHPERVPGCAVCGVQLAELG